MLNSPPHLFLILSKITQFNTIALIVKLNNSSGLDF